MDTKPCEQVAYANVTAFAQWLERERGLSFADYMALWCWSVTDLDGVLGKRSVPAPNGSQAHVSTTHSRYAKVDQAVFRDPRARHETIPLQTYKR